jgi:hypothetical protein
MPGLYPAGLVAAAGRVEDFGLMQTHDGKAYLFVLEEGRLRVFRGGGEGGFEEFAPELPPLAGDVRGLQLFDAPPLQYAAFIVREESGEGVYVLGIDFTGELRPYPAPGLRGFAAITEYRLTASVYSGAAVYVLAGGQLSCTANFCAGGAPVRQMITGGGERIDVPGGGFDLLREEAYPLGRGWLAVPRGEGRDLSFFTLGEDLLLRREGAGFFEGDFFVDAGVDAEGMSYFAVVHGDDFSLYRGDGGAFRREQNPPDADSGGGEVAGGEEGEAVPLCAWGFEPSRACYLIPRTGELAAGLYREGRFEVLERRFLEEAPEEPAAAGSVPAAEYRKSLALNGTLYLAARRGEGIRLYRITAPGWALRGEPEVNHE